MQKPSREIILYRVAMLLSVLIPGVVLLIALINFGFYPFGTKSLLIMDMDDCFIQYYEAMWQVLSGEVGFFFSWTKAMGSSNLAVSSYMLSPFNLIILLFGLENIQFGLFFLTIFKISLCGLTAFKCFSYIFNSESLKILFCSTSYALMTFNIVYSLSITWVDICILLPVIIWGAEKILRKETPYVFIFSLCLSIIISYYLSYMVCIFCALFIICRYLILTDKFDKSLFLRTVMKFFMFALISIGLASWILFPSIADLVSGKIANDNFISSQITNFSIFDYSVAFSPDAYTSITNIGMPALYCGVLTGVLCILFFTGNAGKSKSRILSIVLFFVFVFLILGRLYSDKIWRDYTQYRLAPPFWYLRNNNALFLYLFTSFSGFTLLIRQKKELISVKEKIITLCLFAFMLLSFYLTKLDIAWHWFVSPNWFPYRYSFTFQFLTVFTACNIFLKLKFEFKIKKPVKKGKRKSYNKGVKNFNAALMLVAFLLVCVDLHNNSIAMFRGLDAEFGYFDVTRHSNFRKENIPIIEYLDKKDNSFYRVEKTYKLTATDAIGLGYRGITNFTGTFSLELITFLREIGFKQHYTKSFYDGSTPLTDSLFSVKYILSKYKMPQEYNLIETSGEIYVYENPFVLPVGFLSKSEQQEVTDLSGGNYFEKQSLFLSNLTGDNKSYFKEIENIKKTSDERLVYSFTIKDTNPVYFSFVPRNDVPSVSEVSVFVNDTRIKANLPSSFNRANNHICYLGQFEPGDEVKIDFGASSKNYEFTGELIYYLDITELSQATEKLKSGSFYNISYFTSGLNAEVDADKNGVIFTSIPYDRGLKVKVDGIEKECDAMYDTFLSFEVDKGHHFIEISYSPPMLTIGIIVSSISAIVLLVYVFSVAYLSKLKLKNLQISST